MSELHWAFLIAMTTLALAAVVDRLRIGRSLERLRHRNETLGDDIWEVEAAMEARRRAEAASEAKSRFLATVSHEIRTPLNGILGIADVLEGTLLDREQHAYVEALKTSGRALATLIDEILDFSRIEAGKLELGAAPFDIATLVEGVVELLAPRAQDKSLEIASFIDPALPQKIIGDPVRLRQVLTNLTGNAVKFTDCGGVGLRVDRLPDGRLRFSVSDTGPGVPPAQREAIFEEFEQGDGTAARRHGGTGLGLAISRRIVERMGGTLFLQDSPQGGSTFGFDVMLEPAAAEPDVASPCWPRLDGQKIVIAGDSIFQAPFLAAQLEAAGASVTSMTQEALVATHLDRHVGIDLMFVDCALGQAATERLLDAARRAGVRQIFLLFSPFERRAFGQKLVAGYDGWLVKPVRAGSLGVRIAGETFLPPKSRDPRADENHSPRQLRRSFRVLLAEDNEINALVAMNYLGRLGAQAVHASDGTRALALALAAVRGEAPRFDAIIMDVSMPGLDGLEVTRRLRLAEAAGDVPPTPIIGLTAHAFAEDRTAFLGAGMDDVLIKPIEFAKFSAALDRQEALDIAV